MNYRYEKRKFDFACAVRSDLSFILGALSSVGGSYKAEGPNPKALPPLSLSFNFEKS